MQVVFTKGPGTSYQIAIERERGPALAPRNGVGGHEYLPHDLIHLVVEATVGIDRGVFGDLAAGGTGIFWPADTAERAKAMRRRKKNPSYSSADVEADHNRSEHLVRIALAVWELRRGLRSDLPAHVSASSIPPEIDAVVERLDDHADRWHALPVGGTLTVTW